MDWNDDGGPMEIKYKNSFQKRSQFTEINIYTTILAYTLPDTSFDKIKTTGK